MARINTYSVDSSVQKDDKLLGSNSNGTTRNFSIEDIGTFQASTNAGAVIGQLPYVYHNRNFGGNPVRQRGSITIDNYDASTAFSSVTTIKVSKYPNGYENDAVAVINAFLNKEIIIASQDTPNDFGIFTCTAVTQDSVETDFYDLTLTYSSGNGSFEVDKFYSAARYIGSDLNTTYDLSVPSATTSIRLAGSDSTNDDITITGSGTTTVTRTSGTELTINSTDQYTGTVTGTGTTNYLSKFTGSSAIGDSVVFDNGTNVGIGTTSPSEKLHVDGNARVTGAIYDSNNEPGTSGQLLSSTATGTDWIDQGTITASNAEHVVVYAKNTHTASIAKGTPVYITGTVGATDTVEIAPADASNSAKMPAVGILDSTLAINDFGYIITGGFMDNITTDPIDGATPNSNDTVYVKAGGGLTLTKPTGSTNLIQNIAKVGKVSGGNAGSLIVSSILRTNDIPNLTTGKIWVGDSNTIESATVHLDEANTRLGVGTTTPSVTLDVNGAGRFNGVIRSNFLNNYANSKSIIGAPSNYVSIYDGSGVETVRVDASGNVGIGTTSPLQKLHVIGSIKTSNKLFLGGNTDVIDPSSNSGMMTIGSNQPIRFTNASSTEYARITTSGNVGIGTTSPGQKLTVEGNIELGTGGYIYGDTTTPYVRLNNAAGAELAYGATNKVSVGGPTTITSSAVDVARFRSNKVIFTQPLFVGTSNINDTPTAELQVKGAGSTSSTSALLVQNSATTELFRVRDDGSVYGIGAGGVDTNAAYGKDALINNTTAASNVAVGYQAMLDATTGGFNVAVGELALSSNTTATNSVAIGRRALQNANVNQLVAVGSYAGSAHTTGAQSTYLGYAAGGATTTGGSNTAVGSGALNQNVTGSNNTAIGKEALRSNTASNNIAIGSTALYSNTSGASHVAIGYQASYNNTTASDNVSIGYRALFTNSTGTRNVAVGKEALRQNTGSYNTAIGQNSLYSNTASNMTAVGYESLFANTTGVRNTALGYRSLKSNVIGRDNTAIGSTALEDSSGSENTAIGSEALQQNTTASQNTAVGYRALQNNITGAANTSVGTQALKANTSGGDNTGLGYSALVSNNTGSSNVAIGRAALNTNTSGNFNIAIGKNSLLTNSTGSNNVAIGDAALQDSTASGNTATGKQSAFETTTGSNNTAAGYQSLYYNTTGANNVAMGYRALMGNGVTTNWSNAVGIGYSAGQNNTANNLVAIGYQSGFNNTGASNSFIGYAAGQSNTSGTVKVAIGSNADQNNTTGGYSVFIGGEAGQGSSGNTTASGNVGVGYRALFRYTTGSSNVAIGGSAMFDLTTGSTNVAVGSSAAYNLTTASDNVAIGALAMYTQQTGIRNVAIGKDALRTADGGLGNIAVGVNAWRSATTGSYNVGMGDYVGYYMTTGSGNVGIGYRTNFTNTAGNYNVAVGYSALNTASTGSYNVALGYAADSGGFSESVILGRSAAATASNQFVVGSSSYNVGAVTTETITADKTWTVKINGTDYKIPIVAA